MTDLETAQSPESLRRVVIEPVTRVEGHGKVTLLVDDQNRVQQARLHIVEFRGFERFIEGRPYWEIPVMVQRLCGICPVSHHLAASKALDQVLGATITPSANKMRRLMHYGQMLQSHALHFFHLSSPDLLFGFDADPATRNVVGVVDRFPEAARQGVFLRKFGQEIIRATSGKRVHGTGAVPGGMNRHLDPRDQTELAAQLPQILAWCAQAVDLAAGLHAAQPQRYETFGRVACKTMSLVSPDGGLELYDGVLRVRDSNGHTLIDQWPSTDYADLIREQVKSWSYMKFPYLSAWGPENGWYRVGPLARLLNCDHISTPGAEAARQAFRAAWGGGPIHGVLAYHWARMIEMWHAAEVVASLLMDDDLLHGELMATGTRQREGVGIIEAPRGTLIHHYEVGDDDLVKRANLIVSTTHNNQAMNETVREVARAHFDGRQITEGLLNHIEVAIRAYDPCLSCATHALGQMPLEVSVIGADEQCLDRVIRTPDRQLHRDEPV